MAPVPPAQCLCGGVKLTFRADAQPITAHCFCEHCSQNAGGLSQLTMLFDGDAVTVEDPENLIVTYNVTGTASGQGKPKSFCGRCGCTMFTRPAFYEGKIFVRASLIPGGCKLFKPDLEVFTRNRPAYVAAVEGAAQFDGPYEEKV